ncbi:hypothetical protein BJ4_37 [Bacillus phage BJ4]|nr:hypothetical protein BJ4_37 [Bacillus phage BJ4]
MLQIVDNENNEGTLTITDAGDRLKFKVSDNNTDEQYSIKLGYKKLKKAIGQAYCLSKRR